MKFAVSTLLSAAACLAGTTISAQTLPDRISEAGVVRIALEIPYVPMEYPDPETGELTGFDIELAAAMAEILGVKVEYEVGAFEALTTNLQSGRVDLIMSGFYDRPARREYFDFVHYLRAGGQFFALDSREDLQAPADLCGLTVSTIRATSYPETIKAVSDELCVSAGLDPITVMEDTDASQLLINLKTGRADAAMQGLESIPTYMTNDPGVFRPLGEPVGSALMGMAFNKTDTELRDAFVHALTQVIEDGTYAELIDKYQLDLSAYTDVTVGTEFEG
ncbi:ABC transporter substrate-binding protein [Rubellimicrobium arenae]|uniref:ABC transporter substrate-binding protein n=1 Tax=Rubellimicrobium arenae TaxID=2817372 RepID=UPI001B30A64A|nr:ABC transporter substrate-binding protein [Rubellimicrobium arenae]